MALGVVDSLESLPAERWNALAGDDFPFLRHEFLSALEATGCVSPRTGWQPQHLVVIADDGPQRGQLLGAVPMYLKHHSYGEYVFDWAWANAYAHAGENYYPKLVVGVPFTPVTGPRLLVAPGVDPAAIRAELIRGAWQHLIECGASSLHWLFVTDEDADALVANDFMLRTGYQFHWSNPGYRDFDDFLSSFTAEKRKKVKRERRSVREAGITVDLHTGASLAPNLWDRFYDFYLSTIRAHQAYAYLSREFFHRIGESMRDRIVLMLARKGDDVIAGALNLRGERTLYGRYWGARGDYPGLHFETCYYRAIEFCIAQGLHRFEAGAQGGHKLARGFMPTVTRSAHRLKHPKFDRAVAEHLRRERQDTLATVEDLNRHRPFKKSAAREC